MSSRATPPSLPDEAVETIPHAPAPAGAQPLSFELARTDPDLVATRQQGSLAMPDLVATALSSSPGSSAPTLPAPVLASGRTTVLPRLDGVQTNAPKLVSQTRPRYEQLKVLGRGGMGEVTLEVDRDIGRSVAIKRLLPQVAGDVGVARFVDEVRVMGRLEHPNIVPVHDVGMDEQGRYYLVMKHVEGETLEQIIEKLRRGDPAAKARFSHEVRVEIFLGLLRALQFAHERGFVHRDVKPANVMVGRYGEVMLMDWGIAKPLAAQPAGAPTDDIPAIAGVADLAWAQGVESGNDADQLRLSATRMGQLVGTPAYMCPEQAQGRNDLVDQRSDLFSAAVVFRELLTLEHYLAGAKTLDEVLQGVLTPKPLIVGMSVAGGIPTELGHFLDKAMEADPLRRFQSAAEMIEGLVAILEGRVHVQCPATLTKRMTREAGRFVDRHPHLAFGGMVAGAGVFLFALVQMVQLAIGG